MKVGIVGAGAVGTSCAKAMLLRGSCHEIVLHDLKQHLAQGVAIDLSHGEVLCPPTRIRAGGYEDLGDASIVVITAGINEQTGGATDRSDQQGRLRLLPKNAEVYADVVPQVAKAAPEALILVVTDPPDPLADVARRFTSTNPILSAGTFLDTLRFRLQIARRLGCHPSSVDALVIGEHGTSQVYVWSSAQVGGTPVLELVARDGQDVEAFKDGVQDAVRQANIDIIEKTGASQHGIGIVVARLVEAVHRDEGLVAPVGVFQEDHGVTFSLPSILGENGVSRVLNPPLAADESSALEASVVALREALDALPRHS